MKLRPHQVLFAPAILLLVMSFFINDQTTDVHVYDTHYIVGVTEYYIVLAFLLLFVGILYWAFRRYFYSRFLSWLHVSVHLLTVLFAAVLPLFVESFAGGHTYRTSDVNGRIVFVVLAVWIISQVIFLYQVITGYRKTRKR